MLVFNKSSNIFTATLFPNVAHGFGTRMSGNGRDKKEIEKYLHSHNIQFKTLVDPNQQHTDQIVVNPTSDVGEACDGLISDQRGIVLSVITADCAPIIYADVSKNIVGISHNGRKGSEQKLAQKMINKFHALGSVLYDLRVAIGPAIGACCYPMNLNEENVNQLLRTGLKKDQIDFFPFCTKCDSKRFFSYRGSEVKENFPEQFSFICLA